MTVTSAPGRRRREFPRSFSTRESGTQLFSIHHFAAHTRLLVLPNISDSSTRVGTMRTAM